MQDADDIRSSRWPPRLALLAVGVVYLLTAAQHLTGADNAEFVTIAFAGGVAHPPGYPLYTYYLQALSWLPGSSPAHVAALATVVLGFSAVVVVYFAARAWGASRFAAAGATFLFGLSTEAWIVHTHAEAFALNNLVAASVLLLAAPQAPVRGVKRVVLLGVVAAVGIAHHHSCILLAPIGLYGVWRGLGESQNPSPIVLAAGAGILATGLLPYLLLFSAGDCTQCLTWGEFRGVGDVVDHFLRAEYGTTKLGIGGEPQPVLHLVTFLGELLFDYAYAAGFIGLFGIAVSLTWSDEETRGEKSTWWLLAAFVVSGPLFVMLFNREPEGIGLEVIRRFYVMPELILAIFISFGIDSLFERMPHRRPWIGAGIFVIGVFLAGQGYVLTTRIYDPLIEEYLENSSRSLPENAIVVGTGDVKYFGFAYRQLVLEERTDVTYIDAKLLGSDWYRPRIETQLEVDLPEPTMENGQKKLDVVEVVRRLQKTGRPVFAADVFTEKIVDAFPHYPRGTMLRLLPPDDEPPPVEQVFQENRTLFEDFRLPEELPEFQYHGWAGNLYQQYAETWERIAEEARKAEKHALADEAEALFRRFAFWETN